MVESSGANRVEPDILPALLDRAECLTTVGRFRDAEAIYRTAIERDAGSRARVEYGGFLFRTDRLTDAAREFRIVLAVAKRDGDRPLRIAATHNLAAVYRELGDWRGAANLQQQSIAAATDGGHEAADDELRASTLSNLANDALRAGQYDLAETLLRRSLLLETATGSRTGQAADWGSLGVVAIFQANYETAVACFRRAREFHRQAGDMHGIGCDLMNLAEVARRLGRFPAAVRLLRQAVEKLEAARSKRRLAKARLLLDQAVHLAQVAARNPQMN